MINNFLSEFKFETPEYLLIFLVLPIISRYFLKLNSQDAQLIRQIKGNKETNKSSVTKKINLPSISLIILSLSFLIISLARPQYGYELVKSQQLGFDVIILLDVSDSMLAEDTKPNRLAQAKRKIQDLLRLSKGNRFALVSYAGTAFLETPLTLDYQALWSSAQMLSPELVPMSGSDLSEAIKVANTVFKGTNSKSDTDKRSKVLIVLSDGEFAEETVDEAIEYLKEEKIQNYFLVMGTENGAPFSKNGTFVRDDEDKLVVSKVEIDILEDKFKESNSYIKRASPTDEDVKEVLNDMELKKLDKSKIDSNNVRKWNEFYQIPLFISFVLLLASWLKARDWKTLIWLSIFILSSENFAIADDPIAGTAESNFRSGNYEQALKLYQEKDLKNPNSFETKLSIGNTLYRLGRFSEAEKEYSKASSISSSNKQKSKALFNRGNSLLQLGQYDESKKQFEESLNFNQEDKEVVNNLNYVNKLLKEEKNKEENKEEKQEKKPEDQEKKQDQEQNGQSGNSGENSENGNQENKEKEEQKHSEQENQGQKQQDKEGEDKQKQEKQDQGQQDKEKQDQEQEGQSKQNQGKENQGKDEDQKESPAKNSTAKPKEISDKVTSQLGSIEESNSSKQQFRYKKVLEELEKADRKSLKNSW